MNRIPLDIVEESDKYVILADLPGVRPDNLEVSLNFDHIEISVDIPTDDDEEVNYIHREIPTGSVKRKLTLSKPINAKAASMKLNNGTLVLELPYAEEARSVKLTLN